jgi:hypothetical protein
VIAVLGPSRASNRFSVLAGMDTHPAVGVMSALATWMNTALPRPDTRGRWLWSISMIRS